MSNYFSLAVQLNACDLDGLGRREHDGGQGEGLRSSSASPMTPGAWAELGRRSSNSHPAPAGVHATTRHVSG